MIWHWNWDAGNKCNNRDGSWDYIKDAIKSHAVHIVNVNAVESAEELDPCSMVGHRQPPSLNIQLAGAQPGVASIIFRVPYALLHPHRLRILALNTHLVECLVG